MPRAKFPVAPEFAAIPAGPKRRAAVAEKIKRVNALNAGKPAPPPEPLLADYRAEKEAKRKKYKDDLAKAFHQAATQALRKLGFLGPIVHRKYLRKLIWMMTDSWSATESSHRIGAVRKVENVGPYVFTVEFQYTYIIVAITRTHVDRNYKLPPPL